LVTDACLKRWGLRVVNLSTDANADAEKNA